jgi:hypothetical protein
VDGSQEPKFGRRKVGDGYGEGTGRPHVIHGATVRHTGGPRGHELGDWSRQPHLRPCVRGADLIRYL